MLDVMGNLSLCAPFIHRYLPVHSCRSSFVSVTGVNFEQLGVKIEKAVSDWFRASQNVGAQLLTGLQLPRVLSV